MNLNIGWWLEKEEALVLCIKIAMTLIKSKSFGSLPLLLWRLRIPPIFRHFQCQNSNQTDQAQFKERLEDWFKELTCKTYGFRKHGYIGILDLDFTIMTSLISWRWLTLCYYEFSQNLWVKSETAVDYWSTELPFRGTVDLQSSHWRRFLFPIPRSLAGGWCLSTDLLGLYSIVTIFICCRIIVFDTDLMTKPYFFWYEFFYLATSFCLSVPVAHSLILDYDEELWL